MSTSVEASESKALAAFQARDDLGDYGSNALLLFTVGDVSETL